MPDTHGTSKDQQQMVAWLGGSSSEIEPSAAAACGLRRYHFSSVAEARSTARRLAREHDGLAVVEASCPAFMAVCRILARSSKVQLLTIHPTTRCMGSISIPPPAFGAT